MQTAITSNKRWQWRRVFSIIVLVNITSFVLNLNRHSLAEATALRAILSQTRDASSEVVNEPYRGTQADTSQIDFKSPSSKLTNNNQHIETNALVSIMISFS